jgi:decaprenylphospho-beta-D-ribofuranose 2-oxidase
MSTSRWAPQTLWGWGRYPRVESQVARPERRKEVAAALADRQGDPVLAFGLGRCYGDAALLRNGRVVLTRRLDRMLDFDPESGWLRCEAGVSLEEILHTFVPRGFFPPVVPGTQFVTVGGAIACDIHGKNHHVDGSFCDHIRRVELLVADGRVVTCGPDEEPELFWATVGGMGLTGLILSCEVQLARIDNPYIEMESIRVENLDQFFEVSAESGAFTHTVSWIDCVTTGKATGRGIFMRGRHAPAGVEGKPSLLQRVGARAPALLDFPIDAPDWLLNQASIKAFNEVYFRQHPKGKVESVVHYEPFFFPLDNVRNWNRMYGPRGFLQYQFVVPPDPEHKAVRAVVDEITHSGLGSFLAVIKEFGERQHGGISFPSPGPMIALDFGLAGQPLFDLLLRLDRIVLDAGGKIYLGKDSRLPRDTFEAMYPELPRWKAVRDAWDPGHVFQSELGRRLGLSGPSAHSGPRGGQP